MFMDPSAFEAEDIERELRDAGLEPETTADAASGFRQTESGNEGPLLIPGKANRASPSSGSSFGLGSAGEGERLREDIKHCRGYGFGIGVGLRNPPLRFTNNA